MEYSKIVEMREPKKDWFILTAAIISDNEGNRIYISNQINRFGFCMATIRDRSKSIQKFEFSSSQRLRGHWQR